MIESIPFKREEFEKIAFSRTVGLLSESQLKEIRKCRVAIPGMGGVGGLHLITLIRTGFTNFKVADFDTFGPENVNRQYGAKLSTFGRPKIEVMISEARDINPFVNLTAFPNGLTPDNLDEFLDGVDLVIDGLDFFCIEERRRLFKRARERNIYVITAGPIGFSCAQILFSPTKGLSFDEYFNLNDSMSKEDQLLAFALGLTPSATHLQYMDLSKVDLNNRSGPSISAACQLCAASASVEALKIVLGIGLSKFAPHYSQYDLLTGKYKTGFLLGGNKNWLQVVKKYFLKKKIKQLTAK